MDLPPIPIGARVYVADAEYTGLAIVLEYDPFSTEVLAIPGPYYCHLLDLCAHQGRDEACNDPQDTCMGEYCRGWYAIEPEGQS